MSPYSWLAAERIGQLLPGAQWQPLFLGGLFKANGRVSWGLTEQRAHGIADCEARATAYGLGPIRWPEPWPTSDLLIARALTFSDQSARARAPAAEAAAPAQGDGHLLKPLALAAMRLAFLEGADLAEPEVVLEAARRAGLDADDVHGALGDPEVKAALRKATEEAHAVGVVGVPTIGIAQELFWGEDRLDDAVAAHRSGGEP
jgi:2-hydroxychromene-2-carboxylate isomerase